MDTFRKQASWIRDSVAKQQQAVLKTFGASAAPAHSETVVIDEAELRRHQQLEKLYATTRAGKHFQRDIVKGVEGVVSAGSKQAEHCTQLAETYRKYGNEGPGVGGALSKAAICCSMGTTAIEKEREALNRSLTSQVLEPLKAMVNGAPLDDARTLTQRYDRLRQEAESQSSVVFKLNQKVRDGTGPPDSAQKLNLAEQRMSELSSAMAVLGKEAASAMIAVEAQQQRLTLQRLVALVEAEKNFHQRSAEILDQLLSQIVAERQRSESLPPKSTLDSSSSFSTQPSFDEPQPHPAPKQSRDPNKGQYFLAEVIHPYYAEGEGELNLTAGDFVVVRQVSSTGWAEGELKGKAGWFPMAYIERRQRVPASKLVERGA